MVELAQMDERKLWGSHVIVNTYRGPTDPARINRGVEAAEVGFRRQLGGKGLDRLVSDSLVKAWITGHTRAAVLDIGSGGAGLFTNFSGEPGVGILTRDYLWKHSNMEVNMVGFTDTPSVSEFLTEQPLWVDASKLTTQDIEINKRILAWNYYYTIASEQTLSAFLDFVQDKHGIERYDVALATKSLRWMPRVLFKEVVETTVDRLRPGGLFIGWYIAGNLSWSFGRHDNGFNTNASSNSETYKFVQVLNLNVQAEKQIEREVRNRELAQQDPTGYRRRVERAWRLYNRLGVLGEKEIPDPQVYERTDSPEGYSYAELCRLAAPTLYNGFQRLHENHRVPSIEGKRAILKDLHDRKIVKLGWTFKGDGFVMRKR